VTTTTDTSAPKNPLIGVGWMIITGILFVGVTALVKLAGTRIPAAESAFLRYVLGLVFLIPMIPAMRRSGGLNGLGPIFAFRGVVHTIAVTLWFYAMARIPIADVTAMNYLSPVYVTLGAALFLGETLAMRRLVAVLGAMIILRPGFREVSDGHIAMLATAVFMASSYLTAKHLSGKTSAVMVVVMLSITTSIGLVPLALAVWVPPTQEEVLILFAVSALATVGHYTMTLAFAAAPVSVTQPVAFLQLIWAVSIGAVFFGEPIDPFVIAGGLIIVGSISYMSWREAVNKRKEITPHATAPKT
jgi:drug/metabolite transporter (DMT)-like permease